MPRFPESEEVNRNQFMITNFDPDKKIGELGTPTGNISKSWKFTSNNNTILNILPNSLDISSEYHKTYDNGEVENEKFREIIKFVLTIFIKHILIPIIKRIGLRYIDDCPIQSLVKSEFETWYNSALPLHRFELGTIKAMNCSTLTKMDDYYLRYAEGIKQIDEKDKHVLIIDTDAYATDIKPEDYLAVTDKLHDIIIKEYFKTIKEPVKEYMRTKLGDK